MKKTTKKRVTRPLIAWACLDRLGQIDVSKGGHPCIHRFKYDHPCIAVLITPISKPTER